MDIHHCSETLLQLSKNAEELIVLNKKIVGEVIHIVEPDPNEVSRLQ
jgi:hypothetical protein